MCGRKVSDVETQEALQATRLDDHRQSHVGEVERAGQHAGQMVELEGHLVARVDLPQVSGIRIRASVKSRRSKQFVLPVATERPRVDAESLQRRADELVSQGAPGAKFEELHRLGWRPPSQRQSDGLQPCGSSCGVCFPEPVLRKRRG